MGEVVLARTLPTLHHPSPPTVHQLFKEISISNIRTIPDSILGQGVSAHLCSGYNVSLAPEHTGKC